METSRRRSGIRLADVRSRNLSLVLRTVDRREVATIAELCDDTSFVRGAVGKMVGQLVGLSLLEDAGPRSSGRPGRPERAVRLARGGPLVVGVDVTNESISTRVESLDAELLGELTEPAFERLSPLGAVERAGRQIASLLNGASSASASTPMSVTVAFPGVISQGRITSVSRHWRAESLDDLNDVLGDGARAFSVVNDGAAAVTAEYWADPDALPSSIVLLHGSDGIAGGAIDHGALITGWEGAAGSFGHIVVEAGGRACDCGQSGCLEQYASVAAIAADAGVPGVPGWPLIELATVLAEKARGGDAAVLAALGGARDRIERVVGLLGPMLSPERIVISGNLAPLVDWLLPDVRPAPLFERGRINWKRPITLGRHGSRSVLLGATRIARAGIFHDPVIW